MSFLPFNFASGVLSKTFFFQYCGGQERGLGGPGEEFSSNVVSGPCLVCNITIVVNCKIIVNSFRLGQRWLTMAGYKNVPREFKDILKD